MSKPNSFPRRIGHKPECMCAGCEFPPANSPRRLSPAPAPESQGESVAAPAEVGQVMGTHHDLCECKFCVCIPDALKLATQIFPTLAQFQDHLMSQKQALSPIPEMAGKVLAIDSALHELDSYLISKGLM